MHGCSCSLAKATCAGCYSVLRYSSGIYKTLFSLAGKSVHTFELSVQMTGVSVIQYYSPQIFASIGIDTSTTLGLQSGNAVIALIGEGLCIWYIDRLGRRGPLVWANAISGFTFVIGTILIKLFPAGANNHNASRAFVAMTWLVSIVHIIRRETFLTPLLV